MQILGKYEIIPDRQGVQLFETVQKRDGSGTRRTVCYPGQFEQAIRMIANKEAALQPTLKAMIDRLDAICAAVGAKPLEGFVPDCFEEDDDSYDDILGSDGGDDLEEEEEEDFSDIL